MKKVPSLAGDYVCSLVWFRAWRELSRQNNLLFSIISSRLPQLVLSSLEAVNMAKNFAAPGTCLALCHVHHWFQRTLSSTHDIFMPWVHLIHRGPIFHLLVNGIQPPMLLGVGKEVQVREQDLQTGLCLRASNICILHNKAVNLGVPWPVFLFPFNLIYALTGMHTSVCGSDIRHPL